MSKHPRKAACPICGKPTVKEHLPFCSPRCAKIDCNRWLSDVYVVPGEETVPLAGTGAPFDEDED